MSCNCSSGRSGSSPALPLPLAITTVPVQPWEEPYDPIKALGAGTIFPSLDLPFYLTGGEGNG